MTEPSSSSPACLRCGGSMTEGYLLDEGGLAGRFQSRWVSGPPAEGAFGKPKPGDAAKFKVMAFRCDGCGWLEHYAQKRDYT